MHICTPGWKLVAPRTVETLGARFRGIDGTVVWAVEATFAGRTVALAGQAERATHGAGRARDRGARPFTVTHVGMQKKELWEQHAEDDTGWKTKRTAILLGDGSFFLGRAQLQSTSLRT